MSFMVNPWRYAAAAIPVPTTTHWRIVPHGGYNGDAVFIAELEWASSAGGANLATGGTPSNLSGTLTGPIGQAFDGNTGTWANTSADNSDLTDYGYIFASAITPYEVRVQAGTSFFTVAPVGFTVQFSMDSGATWESYCIFTGIGTFTSAEKKTFVLPALSIVTGLGRANARGWRINCTADNGAGQVNMAELSFSATSGGASLTPAGYTCSASHNSFSRPAAQAFDGNNATIWSTNNNAVGRLGAVFSTPTDIAEARITMISTNDTAAPKDFTVQYSEDCVTWVTAATFTGINTGWVAATARAFSVP